MKVKFLILLFLLSVTLFSQERVDEETLSINSNNSGVQGQNQQVDVPALGTQGYLMTVLIFIVVIGALYFFLQFIKKVGGSRIGIDNDLIHVVSTRALKGTTALHLVEVGKQIFLVGATDSSINAISEITDKESKDMIALNLSVDNEESKSFVQFFTDKLKKNEEIDSQEVEATTDLNTQKDKLDRF